MSRERLTLGSIAKRLPKVKYTEFAFYPTQKGGNCAMWNELCEILFNRKQITGLPIDEDINRNRWLRHNMRHSGVDNSVNFTIHNDDEFSQLMALYHHIYNQGLVEHLRISHNGWLSIS